MKKKWIKGILAIGVVTSLLVGCGDTQKAAAPKKIVVTYVTAPLNVPTIVEKEKGLFENSLKDMGIEVDYAELTSGADQTQALASGDVQVLYGVGVTSVLLSAANGADIKVLSMYSRSPKAFCLYSRDEKINSPEDLKDKIIAGPTGTILHELLVAYLKTADMTIEDVNYVNMTIPEAKAGLDGGSVDVALMAGATAYQAKQQGYHLITNGDGLVDAGIAVAVTDSFYRKYPEVIHKIKSTQEAIAAYMDQNKEEAMELTAKTLDLEANAVKEMYEYYDFSTEITKKDKEGFQRTADFMYESGMIDKKPNINELFYE